MSIYTVSGVISRNQPLPEGGGGKLMFLNFSGLTGRVHSTCFEQLKLTEAGLSSI